jgi:hypothetical protein
MRKLTFAVLTSIALLLPLQPAAADEMSHGVSSPDKLTWMPFDPKQPQGIQLAVLYGDPSKPGPFGLRMKIPANVTIPSHTHSNAEYITILSGNAMIGWGMNADPSKGDALGPGSFFWMKAGDHHAVTTTSELILDLNSTGPFDLVVDK